MLSIQLLNSIGDAVKNVSQFSSQLDNSVIGSFKDIIHLANAPFFKYVPEFKNWHLLALVGGRCISELPLTRTKALVAKALDKYPSLSVVVVAVSSFLIYIIIY